MLLPFDEALARIIEVTSSITRADETVSLAQPGPYRVLAQSVNASSAHPRFDNAAVDGYAFHASEMSQVGVPIRVAFTVKAGPEGSDALTAGQAARIFTGGRLPAGTAAVAMQEDVDAENGYVTLREPLEHGEAMRMAGTDFAAGELLLAVGTPITPGVAGLLASQGVTRPRVKTLPHIAIVTTGDEIVSPESEPGPGQLRDSIGAMLTLAAAPYATAITRFTPDDPARLKQLLLVAAGEVDAIIVAGGASVGDRDFTARVIGEIGKLEFHGIKVRPGKPLLFGFINGKPVLGLPGNPASAFVCFHLFGVPLLRHLGGWSEPHNLWFDAMYGAEHAAETRDVFARVTISGGQAIPVHEQASFGLKSLGMAEALARLPAQTNIRKGDSVQITLL